MALIYVGVFAVATMVSTLHSYIEEYLGLLWREWATKQSIFRYATHRVYYHLKRKGEVGNPDQRIAEDIRVFSNNTLSFLLMTVVNGSLTVIAFSGVLWSISPRLFFVAVLYASAGTFVTFFFGRPLIRLNYDQLDKEADLRASLIHLRENAESIALSRREGQLIKWSLNNLGDLAANFPARIIAVNRNLKFFSTGYNWMIQIIPALIVAPLFLDGQVGFGVITQSAIAFTHLSGAFSLIVTQFQSISSFTAVFARLALLREAGDRERTADSADQVSRDDGRIAFRGLTLRCRHGHRVLISDLLLDIPHGRRVLVRGPDQEAELPFQASAGLWEASEGHIVRPSLDQILLLPETPYLPPGPYRNCSRGPARKPRLRWNGASRRSRVPKGSYRRCYGR